MNPSADSPPPPKPVFRGTAAPAAHRRRRWPYVAAGLLLALIVLGLWPKPLPVETGSARVAVLQVTVNDEGQTRVKNRYVVSSPAGGHLRRIELKPGAEVEAGKTTLAILETGGADLLDARTLAQAQARVSAAAAARQQASALEARARAAAALARTDLERAQRLFEQRGIAKSDLEQAQLRDTAAQEESRAAVFGLQVAQYEEEQARALLVRGAPQEGRAAEPLRIVAPVTGCVLRVFQESERQLLPGVPLLEIGDATDLEVRIEVLSRDGVAIRPGATVWLDQWGGPEPLKARVRLVEPSAFTKVSALGVEEQRVYVVADLVDPVEKRPTLGDAYRVEARIVLWEGDRVLQVPAGALFQRQTQWSAYVLEGGRARLRDVTVGHSNGLHTEILSGLKEGERVVVYPGDRIENGVRVKEQK